MTTKTKLSKFIQWQTILTIKQQCVMIVALSLLTCCVNTQQTPKLNAELKGNMRFEDNRLFVKTIIEGKHSAEFLFDTGASISVLSDLLAARYDTTNSLNSLSDILRLKLAFAGGEELKYSDIDSTIFEKKFMVDPTGGNNLILGVSTADGHRFWSIDYDDQIVRILPDTTVIDTVGATILSFSQVNDLIFIEVSVTLFRNGKTFVTHYKYLLDTGSPFSIFITDPMRELENFVESIDHFDLQIFRLKTHKDRRFFKLDSIRFFGHSIKNAQAIIVHELSYAAQMNNGVIGSIGMDMLKYFNMIIDFTKRKIVLRAHDRDVEHQLITFVNTLGFQIREIDNVVTAIEKGHNASRAGLVLGDKIMTINNIDSLSPTIFDSLRRLDQGRSITLKILRDGMPLIIRYESKQTLR